MGVTNKLAFIVIGVLFVLLLASVSLNKIQHSKSLELTANISELRVANTQAKQTINDLRYEIATKPTEYLEIVREVDRELCEGQTLVDQILALKSATLLSPTHIQDKQPTKGGGNEARNESSYVDIDGLLSPELKRLLQ